MLTKSCKDWRGVAMRLITSAKMNVNLIASAIRNVLRVFRCRMIGLFITSSPSHLETVRATAMSRDMLCFDGDGTVVASKNGATGSIIHVGGLGEIRQDMDFYGTQAYMNPDYDGWLRKHQRKKRFKGYGWKKVSRMIELQLRGEM